MSRANETVVAVPHASQNVATGETVIFQSSCGLTIREHAVIEMAKAIIGTSAAPCLTGFGGCEPNIAATAARMADALIAELAKPKELPHG